MTVQLHLGDCLEVMRSLPTSSVDSVVTDPPYHLTTDKKGGCGQASVNLDSPYGRARIGTGFMGMKWDGGDIAFRPEVWREALRVLKPGGHLLAFGGSRTYHRLAVAIEDAGFEIRDQIMWIYGSGFPKSHNGPWGGTALKPAHEPIVVARKALAGTVAANVQAHGTGALNIDVCRVPTDEALRIGTGGIPCRNDPNVPRGRDGEASARCRYGNAGSTDFAPLPGPRGGDSAGRWPANVIHDGSDEVLDAFAQFGERGAAAPVHRRNGGKFRTAYGTFAGNIDEAGSTFQDDAGSAARFFYCAKASRNDRNEGCEQMEPRPLHWSSGEKNPGSFQAAGTDKTSQNNHPTVKPTKLMGYLCRLVTPPGGVVLDPFMGSGSTGKAAVLGGFCFVGIELSEAYMAIARARIQHAVDQIASQSQREKQARRVNATDPVLAGLNSPVRPGSGAQLHLGMENF